MADFIMRTSGFPYVSESMVQPQVQTPPQAKYSAGSPGKRCASGKLDE
jgi:hypothetical protein